MNAFKKKVEQAVTVKIEQVPQEKGPEFFSANLQKKKQLAKQLQSELVQLKTDLAGETKVTASQLKEADKVIQAALQKFMMA
jgi:hypothetical protein